MREKAVNTHLSTSANFADGIEAHEMCDKCLFVFDYVCNQYKTQEIYDKIAFDFAFKLKYCHHRYKTQEMCNEVLKFASDWFATSKMIERLLNALYVDDNVLYFHEDSGNVIFSCNKMGVLSIDLNNINLDDTNYDEGFPQTIIYMRLLP